ncbi:MAG: protein sphX [Flavobacteriales bacterium]|nr:protein sphX [Flavobacteriales bacterium]
MRLSQVLMSVTLAGTLFSCGEGNGEGSSSDVSEKTYLTGKIKIDGSSTVFPISGGMAELYRAEEPKVKVIVNKSGSGSGFKMFYAKEIDISDASRPIKEKEIKKCQENGVDYMQLEVAYDGLAVLVNIENDWVDGLSTNELKKLWEPSAEGVVKTWADVREGWPAEEIKLFGPGTASGTFDYFTEAIVGESGAIRSDYSPSEDDDILVQGIAGDKNSLGFFGLAYYEQNKDKLKLVPVNGVLPTMETVKSGVYSPLSRPLYLYVSKIAGQKQEVSSFINFYLKNAAQVAQNVGYVPLPEGDYVNSIQGFQKFIATK